MSNNLLVLQSDFGLVDGAVSAMIGAPLAGVCRPGCPSSDPRYHTLQYLWRVLPPLQTVEYWPEGTTFVSVVDPGVGSKRRSVVALTEKNQYIVTPDNGTLSFIKQHVGIKAVREISEVANRRANTEH